MAEDDFPEFPDFPSGYIPFLFRRDLGAWWEFNNTSNFWCCEEGGIGMEQWFIYDMYFLLWILMEWEGFLHECPMDAELSFWIWDECYENVAFKFNASTITDDGGMCIISGSEYKEMALKISANSETYEPYIWMSAGYGMTILTDDDEENEVRIASSDSTLDTGTPGEEFYLAFGINSSVSVGIQDSIISTTPNSDPTTFDRNLYLKPSEYGRVKFGEYQMTESPTITGYIEIVDRNGRVIKLAVIDYDDEYQEHYQQV